MENIGKHTKMVCEIRSLLVVLAPLPTQTASGNWHQQAEWGRSQIKMNKNDPCSRILEICICLNADGSLQLLNQPPAIPTP